MLPGPPTLPILGNALIFYGDTHHLYKTGKSLCQLYRRTYRVWIGPKLMAIVQKPEDIEVLLNDPSNQAKSWIYKFFVPWIKRGLVTSYGEKWKKSRKLLTPTFHNKILEDFIEVFNKNAGILCDILEEKVGRKSFEVEEYVQRCALDNIAETAMGVALNSQRNPALEYAQAAKTMFHIIFIRAMRPWYAVDFLFNFSKFGKLQKEALKVLHGFSWDVIQTRVKQRKQIEANTKGSSLIDDLGIKSKKAFMDLLLDYYDTGVMTLDEIQEEVDTFLVTGHDTIRMTLAYALYNIAHHPLFEERAYQEQVEIFGEDEREPNMEDLNQMKYMEMLLKETLRLQPTTPVFGRTIEKDLKLDEFSTIPAGAEAIILTLGLHSNPDIWEKPDEFIPDRFLPENSAKRHPYAFLPFGAGPRSCIGMKYAMLEMKATISKILRRFKLKPSNPREALKLGVETVMVSLNGVPISIEHRKQ